MLIIMQLYEQDLHTMIHSGRYGADGNMQGQLGVKIFDPASHFP
jgi:hypothetical protein